ALERPQVVFNAAAYTAVDQAEGDPETAMSVNSAGATNIARAAAIADAAVVHISTDYVFNGKSRVPYKPDDAPAPLNVYGESKLAGEIGVREACQRHLIVRTSWVYSHEGRNFVLTMLRAAGEGRDLRIVNDQTGSPTSSADLAAALISAATRLVDDQSVAGTYHFTNSGETTWYEFAREIFRLRRLSPHIEPVTTEEFKAAATRPRWSVLDCSSFMETFGVDRRSWQSALKEAMEKIP
ncbi:MAG TPA: dTDP-4-dehydrorhamnose reductase, partial [Gemmatimonadaceae bacterium]